MTEEAKKEAENLDIRQLIDIKIKFLKDSSELVAFLEELKRITRVEE